MPARRCELLRRRSRPPVKSKFTGGKRYPEVIDFNKLGPRSAPAIAFRTTRESRFSGHDIEALKAYDRTVHPELKWLVGLPVPQKGDYRRSAGAVLLEGFEDTYQYLPETLIENPKVFEVLVRTGEALDALSFLR